MHDQNVPSVKEQKNMEMYPYTFTHSCIVKSFCQIARPKILVSALYSIQLLSIWKNHLIIDHFNFSSVFFIIFHWSPSIGKLRMTPASFVKNTESYEVCRLVHHYRNGPKRAGLITASVKTVRAVHSCNS